jgi:hypothetical protein
VPCVRRQNSQHSQPSAIGSEGSQSLTQSSANDSLCDSLSEMEHREATAERQRDALTAATKQERYQLRDVDEQQQQQQQLQQDEEEPQQKGERELESGKKEALLMKLDLQDFIRYAGRVDFVAWTMVVIQD